MLKIIVLIKRKPDLTHEEFQVCYETHLRKLIQHMGPHIADYRRTYPIKDHSVMDCLTEIWFHNGEDQKKEMALYQKVLPIIHEDEKNFIDQHALKPFMCQEYDACEELGGYSDTP